MLYATVKLVRIHANKCPICRGMEVQREALEERNDCPVITDYVHCLIETNRTCRGNLKYHTLQTLLHRQRQEFSCSSFPETMKPTNYVPIGYILPYFFDQLFRLS
ncbi:unnamed protein product [Gongylonema pulchrum]|uniref:RGM_N domain-containing protein n=1 Tax=Gongylonema pulchrum TaxID=637853 RepID=A0A183D3B7_9BILA|nr:unnamed protein product [Gongylonema pulchrum]